MQLANFIAVQPLQHILRQPGGVIVKISWPLATPITRVQ